MYMPTQDGIMQTAKLDELANRQSQVLYSVRTMFPFEFFPTVVSVDRMKVDVVRQKFIGAQETFSILVRDIAWVEVHTNFFLATMRIMDKVFGTEKYVIPNLPVSEALKMGNIIEGLLISEREQIDLAAVSSDQLQAKLVRIGSTKATI